MTDSIFPKSHITRDRMERAVRRGHELRSQALYDMFAGLGRRRRA